MAEERCEVAEHEAASLKEKVAELEIEVAVGREELGAFRPLFVVCSDEVLKTDAILYSRVARLEGEGEAALAEGAEGGGDGVSAQRSSLAFIQLEKQNGRLKDALVRCVCLLAHVLLTRLFCSRGHILRRLRDLTSETEAEHKRKISDLENELDLTSALQSAFLIYSSAVYLVPALASRRCRGWTRSARQK